jgi:hypothetical protein
MHIQYSLRHFARFFRARSQKPDQNKRSARRGDKLYISPPYQGPSFSPAGIFQSNLPCRCRTYRPVQGPPPFTYNLAAQSQPSDRFPSTAPIARFGLKVHQPPTLKPSVLLTLLKSPRKKLALTGMKAASVHFSVPLPISGNFSYTCTVENSLNSKLVGGGARDWLVRRRNDDLPFDGGGRDSEGTSCAFGGYAYT